MKKILSVLLVLLIGLSLFGCSQEKKDDLSVGVDNYISELKDGAKDKISDYVDEYLGDSLGIVKTIVTDYIYDLAVDFDYSCDNQIIEGDTGTIDVSIKAYDLGKLAINVAGEYVKWTIENIFTELTDEQRTEQIKYLITSAITKVKQEGKTFETKLTVTLNKVNDEWVVDEGLIKDSIVDAITGGLKSSFEDIVSKFNK